MFKVRSLIVTVGCIYASALSAAPQLGGCPIFPANNIWNVRVDNAPLAARSADYVASIGGTTGLHPDFGSGLWDGAPMGLPLNIVTPNYPRVPIVFAYADESDPGPYPVPRTAAIEGGPASQGDRHVLVIEQGNCQLFELYSAVPQSDGSWRAGSGAVYDLRSNALRPETWTSADAAGLPIVAGLARCEELNAGVIEHALRFTAQRTQRKYVWPARHFASSITDPNVPPMGQRFRLKASFDLSTFAPQTRVILKALQTYGMILADNGSNWYVGGAPGECWNDDILVNELRRVRGSEFEAVDVSGLMQAPDSGATTIASDVPVTKTLTLTKLGSGAGSVTSDPSGIDCGVRCSEAFNVGTTVSLNAKPTAGSSFVGWSGSCAGTNTTTQVRIDAERSCAAEFRLTALTADLALTTQAPARLSAKSYFSVRITVVNGGPASARNTRLRISLPAAGLRFIGASTGCSYIANTVTCRLGDIPSSVALSKSIRMQAQSPGRFSVQAGVVGDTNDANPSNNVQNLTVLIQ